MSSSTALVQTPWRSPLPAAPCAARWQARLALGSRGGPWQSAARRPPQTAALTAATALHTTPHVLPPSTQPVFFISVAVWPHSNQKRDICRVRNL